MRGEREIERRPDAEALRWVRQEYLGGVRQKDLAEKIGAGQSYVAAVEAGKQALTEERARAIAEAVGRTPEDKAALRVRLFEAIATRQMPELLPALELRRLETDPNATAGRVCARWAREVVRLSEERGIRQEDLARSLSESAEYVARLLRGEVIPSRGVVRILAGELGALPAEHLLLAGYLPDEAADHVQEFLWLTAILTGDATAREIVLAALEKAAGSSDGTLIAQKNEPGDD